MKIRRSVFNEIIRHGREDLPIEACGYVLGGSGMIVDHRRMKNMDLSNEHFTMDPAEQFQAMKDARAKGEEIIGNYHSHPETPARPSVEDIRLAHDPDILYLIASYAQDKPVLKAFIIKDGTYTEENLEIID